MSRSGRAGHRQQRGRAVDDAVAAAVDPVGLIVRRVALPAAGWLGVPAVVWIGTALGHHEVSSALAAGVTAGAAAGAAVAVRRGARTAADALAASSARVVEAEAAVRAQERSVEHLRQANVGLVAAVEALRETNSELVAGQREALARAAGQDRDFRNVTLVWLDYYQRVIDAVAAEVKSLVDGVREGRIPGRPAFPALPERPHRSGPFGELDAALALLRHQVVDAVAQAAAVDGEVAELEVFAEIAQRLHGRANRVLRELDELESRTEDPDATLAMLGVDHKVTQIRRDVEAVQVLSGGQLRQAGGETELWTILRQATAEIEDFGRVRITQAAPTRVVPYVRSALIHILAALLENAARFSRKQVQLASRLGPSGLTITVEDQGIHMPAEDLRHANAMIADPRPADVRARLKEGRIGILLIAKLARQHGLSVVLEPNTPRGTRAVVTVPAKLLVAIPEEPPRAAARKPAGPQPSRAADVRTAPPQGRPSLLPVAAPAAHSDAPALPRRRGANTGPSKVRALGDRPRLPQRSPTSASPSPQARSTPVPDASPGLAADFLSGSARARDHGPGTATDSPPADRP
jgi:signal transduction histidine kinase